MSKKTFPCLRIVLNHLKVIYRYNCTKMLQMYLSQPLWKFIAFWCWRSICITIGQIMGNFHYNPINISRVIKKNKFFAFFKCPHTMHWILNVSKSTMLASTSKMPFLPLHLGTHLKEELNAYCFTLKATRVFPISTQAR